MLTISLSLYIYIDIDIDIDIDIASFNHFNIPPSGNTERLHHCCGLSWSWMCACRQVPRVRLGILTTLHEKVNETMMSLLITKGRNESEGEERNIHTYTYIYIHIHIHIYNAHASQGERAWLYILYTCILSLCMHAIMTLIGNVCTTSGKLWSGVSTHVHTRLRRGWREE